MSSPDATGPPRVPASDGDVTVVHAEAVAVSGVWAVVYLGGFFAALVLLGMVVAPQLAVLILVLVLLAVRWVYGMVRRRRPRRAGNSANRLEVRSDRITVAGPDGDLGEIARADGDLLAVRDVHGEPHLYLVDVSSSAGSVGLGRFDVERVAAAARARGWRWQSYGAQMPLDETEPPGREIVLRDGRTGQPVGKKAVLVPAVVTSILVVGTLVAGDASGVDTWLAVGGACAFFGAGVAVILCVVAVAMRRSRLVVAVGRDRVSVRHGSLVSGVALRSSLVSARAGRRRLRLRTHGTLRPTWIPLLGSRDEVLTAMWAYGWPVTDR